jgi:hypothetical protein
MHERQEHAMAIATPAAISVIVRESRLSCEKANSMS